jgi:hypothetical protein
MNEFQLNSSKSNEEVLWNSWTLDKHKFKKDSNNTKTYNETFPLAQKASGFAAGLTFLLSSEVEERPCPQFDSTGFKVIRISSVLKKYARQLGILFASCIQDLHKRPWN